MNIFDILFMRKIGRIKPDAETFDIFLAKKNSNEGLYTSNDLFPSNSLYPRDNKRR